MGWLLKNRRGPEWKHGWKAQALDSISPPPMPLVAIFAIVILFLSMSYYINYKSFVHHNMISFDILLLFLPIFLIFLARCSPSIQSFLGYWFLRRPVHRPISTRQAEGSSSPCGVAVLVVVLLVMVSYQSYFHSRWFRAFWSSDY